MKYIKTFENIDELKDHFTKNFEYVDKLKDEIKLIKKIKMRSDNNDYHFGDNFQYKVNNPNKAIDELTKQVDLFKSVKKYNL